ncbi:MAG TPA: hypothetical protein VFI35_11120 [Actinomycetota bacterium]|nr:hypothetical protein [Actinomycetota bacterium]
MSFIAIAGVATLGLGLVSEGDTRWEAFGFSGLCLAGVIWLLVEWGLTGSVGLELRLDSAGVTIGRHRIPWDAVRTAKWSGYAIGTGTTVRKPGIILHLRDVEGYKAPHAGVEEIDHVAFRIPANILLDAIVRYAHPHTVYVIAVDPDEPWPLTQSPAVD